MFVYVLWFLIKGTIAVMSHRTKLRSVSNPLNTVTSHQLYLSILLTLCNCPWIANRDHITVITNYEVTNRQSDKQTKWQTDKVTNRQSDKQTKLQTNRQSMKQTKWQADKVTNRQSGKQTKWKKPLRSEADSNLQIFYN